MSRGTHSRSHSTRSCILRLQFCGGHISSSCSEYQTAHYIWEYIPATRVRGSDTQETNRAPVVQLPLVDLDVQRVHMLRRGRALRRRDEGLGFDVLPFHLSPGIRYPPNCHAPAPGSEGGCGAQLTNTPRPTDKYAQLINTPHTPRPTDKNQTAAAAAAAARTATTSLLATRTHTSSPTLTSCTTPSSQLAGGTCSGSPAPP
jgi:hypothetical protein